MKIQIIPEVGDQFKIKKDIMFGFSFDNKAGGTGMSNWDHDPKYQGPTPTVQITKVWYDYECGYRCHAKAVNPELVEYLKKVSKTSKVYVSEHDLQPLQ